jgi:hypothetical protein
MRRYVMTHGIYRYIDGEEFIVRNIATHSETNEKMVVFQRINYPRYAKVMPLSLFISTIPEGTESDVNKVYMFEFVRETAGKGAVR